MFISCSLVKSSFAALAIVIASSYSFSNGNARNFEVIIGHARVKDGDTIAIDGTSIRLIGIDACEMDQVAMAASGPWPCGEAAKRHLEAIIADQTVRCTWTRRDRWRRLLARCFVGNIDLNRTMVADGMAVVYFYRGRPTVPDLVPVEDEAKSARKGLWATIFENPLDHRRKK